MAWNQPGNNGQDRDPWGSSKPGGNSEGNGNKGGNTPAHRSARPLRAIAAAQSALAAAEPAKFFT